MMPLTLSLDSYVRRKPAYLETTLRAVGFVDDVIPHHAGELGKEDDFET
jgi:hypothetical protein